MKNNNLIVLVLLGMAHMVSAQQRTITLYNPLKESRPNELITLQRNAVEKIFTDIMPGQYLKLTEPSGRNLNIQFDDLDGDGKWDEAVFVRTFKPLEKLYVYASLITQPLKSSVIKAHVRHRRLVKENRFGPDLLRDSIPPGQQNADFSKVSLPDFLTEGPSWENDKIGFRIYFDMRNGKDIWGKITSEMVMDTVGTIPSVSYHKKSWWGMDILKVGSSLSAGALALSFKTLAGSDSLVRLGGKNMGKVIYQKISDGPVRATFRLTYPEWKFSTEYPPATVSEEVSIWEGQFCYRSVVRIANVPATANLVTGFANFYNLPSEVIEGSASRSIYSFGKQSENGDNLGLAIVAPKTEIYKFSDARYFKSEITNSHLVFLKIPKNNKAINFIFYAGWEQSDPRFTQKSLFEKFLVQQMKQLDNNILITWK